MECSKQTHSNIPALRFPDFLNDGEWEVKRLGEIMQTITPPKKLQSIDYQKSGNYPIIDQSQNYICGYSNDVDALVNRTSEDLIVFGDHTCILKIVDFPFIQGADGIKIIKSKDFNQWDNKYVYQYLQFVPIISSEYKRHFSELKEKNVYYPKNIIEQRRIAACLSALDEMLAATNGILEQLKAYKKGLMQKLFPAKGKKLPELRFKEFEKDGEWEVKKLGEIIKTISPTKKLQSSEYKIDGTYPIVDQSQNFICGYSNNVDALINTTSDDFIVFGDHTCTLKFIDFPFIQGADGIKVFHSTNPNKMDNRYLYQYLVFHPVVSKEYKRHFSELKEMIVIYPKQKTEQIKISFSLFSLDKMTNALIEKLALLTDYKKGLMQQLFPTSK